MFKRVRRVPRHPRQSSRPWTSLRCPILHHDTDRSGGSYSFISLIHDLRFPILPLSLMLSHPVGARSSVHDRHSVALCGISRICKPLDPSLDCSEFWPISSPRRRLPLAARSFRRLAASGSHSAGLYPHTNHYELLGPVRPVRRPQIHSHHQLHQGIWSETATSTS